MSTLEGLLKQNEDQEDLIKEYMEEIQCLKETIADQEEIIKNLEAIAMGSGKPL